MPQGTADELAHLDEHCLEVQLPLLCSLRQHFHIVPIILGTTELQFCLQLGDCLTELLREAAAHSATRTAPLLVATTDFTHYESDAVTRKKDEIALENIRMLDSIGLHQAVHTHRISMCGLGPTIAALQVAKANQIDLRDSRAVCHVRGRDRRPGTCGWIWRSYFFSSSRRR